MMNSDKIKMYNHFGVKYVCVYFSHSKHQSVSRVESGTVEFK